MMSVAILEQKKSVLDSWEYFSRWKKCHGKTI